MGEGAAWGRVRGVGGGEITKGTQIKKTVILDEKGRRGFNFSSAYPIAISVPLACDGAAGVFWFIFERKERENWPEATSSPFSFWRKRPELSVLFTLKKKKAAPRPNSELRLVTSNTKPPFTLFGTHLKPTHQLGCEVTLVLFFLTLPDTFPLPPTVRISTRLVNKTFPANEGETSTLLLPVFTVWSAPLFWPTYIIVTSAKLVFLCVCLYGNVWYEGWEGMRQLSKDWMLSCASTACCWQAHTTCTLRSRGRSLVPRRVSVFALWNVINVPHGLHIQKLSLGAQYGTK